MDGFIEPIYKLAYVSQNTIYVFIGSKAEQKPVEVPVPETSDEEASSEEDVSEDEEASEPDDLDLLFKQNPANPIFEGIFTAEELEKITENNKTVIFLPERIHLDDTIEIIKKKILMHLMADLDFSFDEIYIFIKQTELFNAATLFNILTQNDKLELSKERFEQFLLNVDDVNIDSLPPKEVYDYADIVNLNIDHHTFFITKPLGQQITTANSDYPYTINPFDAISYDPYLEKFGNDMITTTNKSLLMQHSDIAENTIYLCLAKDVLLFTKTERNLPEPSTIKIYFPYLHEKNIVSLVQLIENREILKAESQALITSAFEQNIKNINLFYENYANRNKDDLKYIEMGIKSIIMTLKPAYKFYMPLDVVFKLIHATKDVPLIKMNLSKKRENIYRLYTDKIATNGTKIPYLAKGVIFKWIQMIGKSRSVAVYIEYLDQKSGSVMPIICEFEINGNITIKANFATTMKIDEVNELFTTHVNPVIDIVKEYLEQGGYNMYHFTDLKSNNVEIINIDFVMHIPITHKIIIKKIIGCVSSVFNVVTDNLSTSNKGNISMRFKRVANYNEMDAQDSMIVDMSKPELNYTDNEIISELKTNFNLSEDAAREKYIEVKRSIEEMQLANRRLKIINNPGFLTRIYNQEFNKIITINVTGINNITYLSTLYVYLDTILRITQKKSNKYMKNETINSRCSGSKIEEEEENVKEIVAEARNENEIEEPVSASAPAIAQEEEENIELGDKELGVKELGVKELGVKELGVKELVFNIEEEEEKDKAIEAEAAEELTEEQFAAMNEQFGIGIGEDDDEDNDDNDDDDEDEESGGAGKPKADKADKPPKVAKADKPPKAAKADKPPKAAKADKPPKAAKADKPPKAAKADKPPKAAKAAKDDEEEDTNEEDDDDDLVDTDITGMSLANPNPFAKRMMKRDKNLFETGDKTKKFTNYSRSCPWDVLRQPVILTDEEKERIDREHPGSYQDAVKYGSNPNNKFWYICPRYWDLKNNTSLNETDPEFSKSKVIPAGQKKVAAGTHIFEFNDHGAHHMKGDKYINHSPGFLKPSENGKCLPCCFKSKSFNGDEQWNRRKTCTNNPIMLPRIKRKDKIKKKINKDDEDEDEEEEETVEPAPMPAAPVPDAPVPVPDAPIPDAPAPVIAAKTKQQKKEIIVIDEYILGVDKYPITEKDRFGYLPIAIQKFLGTDNNKCKVSQLNSTIKPNHPCLLRYSVEISSTQSFVACIADLWYSLNANQPFNKEKRRPSIKRMKNILIDALSIDTFVSLQNGSLIQLFYTTKKAKEASEDAEASDAEETDINEEEEDPVNNIEIYADIFSQTKSKLYEVADKRNPAQMSALIKVAKSYKNFIDYLKDDTVEIDHSYLWDLICLPNPKLFIGGLNLAILNLPRKDITDNVEIICPSNHYSSVLFDETKPTVIILKIDNYYEPICDYENNTENGIIIGKTFRLNNPDILPNIVNTLNLIKKSMQSKCGAFNSKPNVYRFEQNIPLKTLITHLKTINYTVDKQVLNYDSKVIGLVVLNTEKKRGFIPCFPSALNNTDNTNLIWMDDVYTDTYDNTKAFLEEVYKKNPKILCKPRMKVAEDGLIVGIITMTNQFIMISEPAQNMDDDLPVLNSLNYNDYASDISTSNKLDDERIIYIKKIQLETKFYNVFRNTAKFLLGQPENKNIRSDIIERVNSSSQLYLKKISSIEKLLRDLMEDRFIFEAYDESDLLKLDKITSCNNKCKNKPYCKKIDGTDKCVLMIPSVNLISDKLNNTFYFGKLADEIVRYSRINSFLFNPKIVLSFSPLTYNLREDEIILLNSLLTQDYFDNITYAQTNKYITYNTYDTTNPLVGQKYSNIYTEEAPAKAPAQVPAPPAAPAQVPVAQVPVPAPAQAQAAPPANKRNIVVKKKVKILIK